MCATWGENVKFNEIYAAHETTTPLKKLPKRAPHRNFFNGGTPKLSSLLLTKKKLKTMARRKYVEKVRFYAFLDTLTQLADNCSTEPYYFKEYTNIDVLLVVTRINDPFKFLFKFFQKPLVCRNSFSSTRLMYQLETDESTFQMVLFDPQVVFIQDFLNFLQSVETNGELKQLFDDLIDLDMNIDNMIC